MNTPDYIIVSLFLLGIFWAGSYFYRWIGDPDDFYVAGRKITPFILAATLTATNISLYSFVGVSGTAYKHGISIIWQTWTGNMALVFSGLFVIPILRRLKIRTIPEFLEMRYNRTVRLLVSFLWMFRLAFWLGVVLYAGVTAAQKITGFHSFEFWVLLFSLVIIIYTMLGGMWSIILTDAVQFLLMMTGVLILLPLAMKMVGWWPGLAAQLPAEQLTLVTQGGKYNYKFIFAILLLGIQWACLDQGLLQRTFSANSTKTVAKGLVLSGIITTPFAFLWITPGLAAKVLHPSLSTPEFAVPTLIVELLPSVILGLVICGLLASQMSTIDSNLGASATLFTHDIYSRYFGKRATTVDILRVVRIATVIIGGVMIAVAYLVPYLGGTVDAYLTIISIMDMPLFVIAIVYGLLWKRATPQGAIAGYLTGALAGAIFTFGFDYEVSAVTFISGGVALIVCPLVSIFTRSAEREKVETVFAAKRLSEEEKLQGEPYHLFPISAPGRWSLAVLGLGAVIFVAGVALGGGAAAHASLVAVVGMIIYFLGGYLRTRFD